MDVINHIIPNPSQYLLTKRGSYTNKFVVFGGWDFNMERMSQSDIDITKLEQSGKQTSNGFSWKALSVFWCKSIAGVYP